MKLYLRNSISRNKFTYLKKMLINKEGIKNHSYKILCNILKKYHEHI
jgi:hypothetical protein